MTKASSRNMHPLDPEIDKTFNLLRIVNIASSANELGSKSDYV